MIAEPGPPHSVSAESSCFRQRPAGKSATTGAGSSAKFITAMTWLSPFQRRSIDDCRIDVSGDAATAVCMVSLEVRVKSGGKQQDNRKKTFRLRRQGASWIIQEMR